MYRVGLSTSMFSWLAFSFSIIKEGTLKWPKKDVGQACKQHSVLKQAKRAHRSP